MNTRIPRFCKLTISALLLSLLVSPAWAQTETVERAVKGQAGRDIRIGVFISIGADCKAGSLPTIRLKQAPAHGAVTVKQGKLRTTNLRQCLAVEVPAFIVVYKSKPEFSGDDTVMLEVINASGKTQLQRITVSVATNSGGQPI
jgi:hypothetical protein